MQIVCCHFAYLEYGEVLDWRHDECVLPESEDLWDLHELLFGCSTICEILALECGDHLDSADHELGGHFGFGADFASHCAVASHCLSGLEVTSVGHGVTRSVAVSPPALSAGHWLPHRYSPSSHQLLFGF